MAALDWWNIPLSSTRLYSVVDILFSFRHASQTSFSSRNPPLDSLLISESHTSRLPKTPQHLQPRISLRRPRAALRPHLLARLFAREATPCKFSPESMLEAHQAARYAQNRALELIWRRRRRQLVSDPSTLLQIQPQCVDMSIHISEFLSSVPPAETLASRRIRDCDRLYAVGVCRHLEDGGEVGTLV